MKKKFLITIKNIIGIFFLSSILAITFVYPSRVYGVKEGLPSATSQNTLEQFFGVIKPPDAVKGLGGGAEGVSNFLNRGLSLIYSLAVVLVLFMIIYAALQFILSGGDKEKTTSARNRITYALVGLTLLALAFLITQAFGNFLGFKFLN